jgi:energy-coupling factor transporter ATP-binding protein EcfA2
MPSPQELVEAGIVAADAARKDRAFSAISSRLAADLAHGRHVVLWGPRGSGKTTLLNAVLREIGDAHAALSPATSSLDDITRALERAYAEVHTAGLARRAARSRLWWAADAEPGCLLLDHVTRVPSAMKGWLRRLRGGLVGVALAIDVDSDRERERMRALKIGCATFRMPPTAAPTLARLLSQQWEVTAAFPLPAGARRSLVRAARGRPGWVVQCAALSSDLRYWPGGQLRVPVLALDTEIRLRSLDPAAGLETLAHRSRVSTRARSRSSAPSH